MTNENGRKPTPITVWRPQPGPQTHLLICPYDDIMFGGARGGGKTDGMIGHWIKHSNEYGKYAKGLFIRRTMNELTEPIQRMKEILPLIGGHYHETKKMWSMDTGALLRLSYLDRDADADQYQGHSYTVIYVDELGNFKNPDPINKLQATLRSPHKNIIKQFIATSNPGGPGHEWIKKKYKLGAKYNIPPLTPMYDQETKTTKVFIASSLKDNRILMENDPNYINRLKASGPAWLVNAWLNGDWDSQLEGAIFKRENWRYYSSLPTEYSYRIQSWDTAFKAKQKNDYSVCITAVIDEIPTEIDKYTYSTQYKIYIENVWRDKVEFPELKVIARQLHDKYQPQELLIEDKASGQSLIQELERDPVIADKLTKIRPDSDKLARAYAASPLHENGSILLPHREEAGKSEINSEWIFDLVQECMQFSGSSNDTDDQVDALTQIINYVKQPEAVGVV